MSQATLRKTRSTARKRKGKIKVKQSAELRKKGSSTAKYDTMKVQTPRDNAATLKLKIKRK